MDTHGKKSDIGALVIPLNERRPSVDDEPGDTEEQVTLYPEAPSRYSL